MSQHPLCSQSCHKYALHYTTAILLYYCMRVCGRPWTPKVSLVLQECLHLRCTIKVQPIGHLLLSITLIATIKYCKSRVASKLAQSPGACTFTTTNKPSELVLCFKQMSHRDTRRGSCLIRHSFTPGTKLHPKLVGYIPAVVVVTPDSFHHNCTGLSTHTLPPPPLKCPPFAASCCVLLLDNMYVLLINSMCVQTSVIFICRWHACVFDGGGG